VQGPSPASELVRKHIELVAPTDMTVLISGETGTGKEYVARAIHTRSKRTDKPFVAVDCGALPKELAGSELFGHVKGSFTGAIADKRGSFEEADGGTLFLDEIGNLTYENQMKLLRVLQERTIRRLGSEKEIPVDVRVLAATNADLRKSVAEGRFREDLFHRINEFSIELLPLRDRRADIEIFARHFLGLAAQQLDKQAKEFAPNVRQKLLEHQWHGNLRELGNVVRRAVLLADGPQVTLECLPVGFLAEGSPALRVDGRPTIPSDDLRGVSAQAERQAILAALERTGFNKSRTATLLNIDRKTLYNKLKALGIEI
jgi:two-component system response regulator HydG